MFDCKAKITLLCIFGMLVVFDWADTAEYYDDSENEGKFNDLSRSELVVDDTKNEDLDTLQTKLGFSRKHRVKMEHFAYDRRRRTGRRRSARQRGWWG